METIPEVKIEGLEEALQQLGALSRAIDSVTESARLASSALSDFFPTDAVRLSLQTTSPFGGIDPLRGGSLPASLDNIATPLSGILIPELSTLLQTISETAEGIRQATAAVGESLDEMKAAVESFTPPVSVTSFPLSVPIEQEKGLLGWTGTIAEGAGYSYFAADPVRGAVLIGGGLVLQSIEGDGFYDYDEDAASHMKRVQEWGYGSINDVEDGWLINRNMEADRRARDFNDEFAFFNARLKELDKEANVELTPLLDNPSEFGRREQARALRTLYSKDLLDLIEQYKVAVGRDPVVTPTIDVGILSTAHPGVDTRALEIAKTYASTAAGQPPAAFVPAAAPGVTKFEPIQMEIKVLSDYRLSMKTNNPNPNIDVRVDFSCGPRMRGAI
jgi:hypothetical protein